jgi:thiosulfate/3-mercaptopyruvate sulfurtransferase
MQRPSSGAWLLVLFSLASSGLMACKHERGDAQAESTTTMPTLQPEELAHMLRGPSDKPLLLHVGFKKLFQQAHIPGSEYIGPTSDTEVLTRLRDRVKDLLRDTNIVVYCGCCPWERCPNVKPAYEALQALGFTRVKVLYIAEDFGRDWVAKGYPVSKSE